MKKNTYFVILILFLLSGLLSVVQYDFKNSKINYNDNDIFEKGRYYIKIRDDIRVNTNNLLSITSDDKLNNLLREIEITEAVPAFKLSERSKKTELSRIYEIELSKTENVSSIIDQISLLKSVEYIERVPKIFMHDQPNDESYSSLQHLPQIYAEEAWDVHKGEDSEEKIVIAIVDSGVEWKHPDLIDNIWNNLGEDVDGDGVTIEFIDNQWVFDPDDINGIDDDGNGYIDDFVGWNFINSAGGEDNDPSDIMSHGTHCAGISAGVTNNNLGIASISWNLDIMCLKHDIDGGNAFESNTYNGVIYAAENGADVINTSWGCMVYARAHEEVVEYANSLGAIMISSAGNEDWEQPGYPSSYPDVISVASVASNDEKAYYSSFGIAVDIAAPGGDVNVDGGILSTVVNAEYSRFQGTSMAGPLVVGLTGLMNSYFMDFTDDEIKYQLLATTDNIDEQNPNFINQLGSGRINSYRALTESNPEFNPSLRLNLSRVLLDEALNSYVNTDMSIEVRNYTHFRNSENVEFILSTEDPDITIENNRFIADIPEDGYFLLDNAFNIVVAGNTWNHMAEFQLTVNSDIPISYGNIMAFQIPVQANEGVFVWEHAELTPDLSGGFLVDELSSLGLDVTYKFGMDFPASLLGYKAVFLSFGTASEYPYYNVPPNYDDSFAQIIDEYLLSGGNVYIEGNNAMIMHGDGMWLPLASERLEMYGLTDVTDGVNHSISNLQGQPDTFTEGMLFDESAQLTNSSIDIYEVNLSGTPIFIEDGYGIVGVSNEGEYDQRTICFSYCLSALTDNESPSTKNALVAKILEFFEISFTNAEFTTNIISGHAPLEVEFTDLSIAFPEVDDWLWDFQNDGISDSEIQNPIHIYNETGEYSVNLTASNGNSTDSILKEDFIRVFDGTSSLEFDNENSALIVPANSDINLTDAFTFEAWIKPADWGPLNNLGMGNIFSKGNTKILLVDTSSNMNNNSLVLWFYNNNGEQSFVYTEVDAIAMMEWQHIAVTYSETEGFKFIINGEQKEVFGDDISGGFQENIDDNAIIGNVPNLNRRFSGWIDEVRLWNTSRTTEEIVSNYNQYISGSEESLIGYWKMNDGQGDFADDETIYQNNAEVNNVLWDFGSPFEYTSIFSAEMIKPVSLFSNYPNPFTISENVRNSGTSIHFEITKPCFVEINIFNLKGQKIKKLCNKEYTTGKHSVNWKGLDNKNSQVNSGIYFYQLVLDGKAYKTNKCLLVR